MRLRQTLGIALIVGLVALPVAAQPTPAAPQAARFAQASEVQLRNVAGFVTIHPEDRTDVAITVTNAGPLPAPELRVSRNRLIVDGKLRRQIRSCRILPEGGLEVRTARYGRVSGAQLSRYDIRIPQNAVVSADGGMRLHMGPSQSVHLRLDGCGDGDVERTEGEAEVSVSGSPDLRLYDGGQVTVAIAGAGDVTLGVVRSGLTASIAGSGDLTAARVDGPTSIAVQGSGDVLIRDGRSTTLSVVVAGSGDVTHNGTAATLDAVVVGSGDVRVHRVDGAVTQRVLGSGDVVVGR